MARARIILDRPEGLVYEPEFLAAEEERSLLAFMDEVDFREVVMRGQTARRTVRHYGFDYGYESWRLERADPLSSSFCRGSSTREARC